MIPRRRLSVLCAFVPLLLLAAAGCHPDASVPGARSDAATLPASGGAPTVAAAAATGPIRFSDRAEAAGIQFRLGHNGKSPLTILETAGCGCAFLDYDGDNRLDLFFVGQPRCALYRNRGDGTFEDVTKRMGITAQGTFMGVAVADYDNDGRPDVFVSGYGRNALYHNRGDRFEEISAAGGLAARGPYDWATSATFTDLDGDGNLDLAVGHYVTFTPESPQTCPYSGVLASCPPFYYEPQTLRVFRGDGRGRFRDVTTVWGMTSGAHGNNLGVAASDFDNDGRQDLYVANDGVPADLWRREANGPAFRNVGQLSGAAYNARGEPQAGMGVDWGDYDNDGRLDLVVTTFQGEPTALYQNAGGGLLQFASFPAGVGNATLSRLGFGVALADLDNDGWLDLVTANGHVQDTVERFRAPATYRQTLQCFHNGQRGAFDDVSATAGAAFARPIVGRGLAVGDYDNDGRSDLLVSDLEGRPLLLHNDSSPRAYLGLQLIAAGKNRNALGARVTLTTGDGKTQVREVQSGRGYLSASDTRPLFGLGDATTVRAVTVRWPNGKTERFAPPGINHYVVLRQGTGAPAPAGRG